MVKASNDFQYDVFVSYSQHDSKWVHDWLVPKLEEAGLRVWADVQELQLGVPWVAMVERAITHSRIILLVLTHAYLRSRWHDFEDVVVKTLDPAARQRRVIPLMLEPCELPLRIRTLTYADFTKPDQTDYQFNRLLAGIGVERAPLLGTPHKSATLVDYNTSTIRNLLVAAFSDEELTTLCFDHFRSAYEDFTGGMSKGQKIQRLLDHCERHDQVAELLALVRDRNPAQYSRFERRLKA